MLRHRVIPTLLIKNNGLVKTLKFKNPTYIGDPINAVKIFNDKEVDELILLDITATNEKREPDYKKIGAIVSEAFMPVGYGGGINSINHIEKLFKLGIEKVIINTAAYSKPQLINESAKIYGNQSIVVAVDIKKYFLGRYILYSNSGKQKKNIGIEEHINKVINLGCGEIYLNNMDGDGMMNGYDLSLIRKITSIAHVPLIASGGAGTIDHFVQAIRSGASAVSAGSMFVFQGIHRAVLISYPEYSELERLLND